MRLAVMVLVAAVPAAARADGDVNLLVSTPTVVAVSSTVDNAQIVPDHLVDGKLDTAWNSRTGDLAGAWIAFRVPKDAHVAKIRLTAGFTKQDKRLGDLFTENHRVARVRIVHDGKEVGLFNLDPDRRDLQDVGIDAGGGDYFVQLVKLVPGTKQTWREAAISELEVWGTLPAGAVVAPARPVVRVGSLDVDCVKTMYPAARINRLADGDFVVDQDSEKLSSELVACLVRHGDPAGTDSTAEIALVRLAAKPAVVARIQAGSVTNRADDQMGAGRTGTVTIEGFPLTASETALLVKVSDDEHGPMFDAGSTKATLYRASKSALVPVLDFESTWSGGESENSDRCDLKPGAARKPLPDLDVACVKTEGRYHGEDPRGNGTFDTPHTEHFRWNGKRYEKR